MNLPDMIVTAVATVARARAEAIEKVCEQAVTGGEFGVSVYEDVVVVDPEVPYGWIHYHQCRRDERRY